MRLALSVGRLDFWNIPTGKRDDSLTPYEESVWRAYEIVEPFGERRADVRVAWNTLHLLQAQSTKQFSQSQVQKIMEGLTPFLNTDSDNSLSPEEAARAGKAAFAGLGK
jgi:hypothetical protein